MYFKLKKNHKVWLTFCDANLPITQLNRKWPPVLDNPDTNVRESERLESSHEPNRDDGAENAMENKNYSLSLFCIKNYFV